VADKGVHSTKDWVQEVFAYDDYSNSRGSAELLPPLSGVPYPVTEAVGALSGPSYFRRTDTQAVQADQARLHAQVHSIAASDDRYCGLLGWCGFDYDSLKATTYEGLKWPGVVDTFRVPKPGAAFYQAQADAEVRPVMRRRSTGISGRSRR
jgi:beta-galactosidase